MGRGLLITKTVLSLMLDYVLHHKTTYMFYEFLLKHFYV